ncbi:MAG: DUF975 family protein, partial [Clostridiales Family XIII bacterium]|nr:DUF975 family protein [Clostridiales Family XIII bacterium]
FIYLLAINLPANIISYITGLASTDPNNNPVVRYYMGELSPEAYTQLTTGPLMILSIYQIVVTGALALGVATCFLRFRRRQECGADVVFSGFNNFGRALILFILEVIFITLWSLLFVFPGIVAAFRYKFAFMILADNPKMSPLEAIRVSKYLTKGNKAKLFCLNLSFIGWYILASLAATIVTAPFTAIITRIGTGEPGGLVAGIIIGIISSLITAVCSGLLTVYVGTAEATLYERAAGLLRMPGDRIGDYGPGGQ